MSCSHSSRAAPQQTSALAWKKSSLSPWPLKCTTEAPCHARSSGISAHKELAVPGSAFSHKPANKHRFLRAFRYSTPGWSLSGCSHSNLFVICLGLVEFLSSLSAWFSLHSDQTVISFKTWSVNHLGWKRPLNSSSSAINPNTAKSTINGKKRPYRW